MQSTEFLVFVFVMLVKHSMKRSGLRQIILCSPLKRQYVLKHIDMCNELFEVIRSEYC